ncbi:Scr1 family TA system antitoxin-like transcriptional regulator, partial [Streptomyces sp. MCAF7]
MPVSPSSSAQAAREAVAQRLSDLRKESGLTVVQLAAACGWHYSKTSRIENAVTGPSATDIRRWCAATHADDQAQELVVQSINAETMYRQWRDQVRAGLRHIQESRVQTFQATEVFRMYSSSLVPGLLQTEGYARAVLGIAASVHDLPTDDSEAAARARIERSRIIHEQG